MTGRMVSLGLGPGGIAGACTAARLHSLVGEILAAAMIAVPLATGVILVAVIVFGSTESSNRVFRLLRWIRDKEEPPAPRASLGKEIAALRRNEVKASLHAG
jgi:hypothetical protein